MLTYLIFVFIKSFFHACSLTTGHELHHTPHWIGGFIGNLSYAEVIMPWYWDEHLAHHHKWVATDIDPVSAPMGTNTYWTLYTAYFKVIANVWNREEMKIKKTYGTQSWLLTLTANKMVMYLTLIALFFASIYHIFGWGGLCIQLWTWLLGILWMEGTNYVEHYGLRREKDENGIYESVQYQHAWNSLASPVLSRIQRHSDHHAHKYRPYQVLRQFERAPHMPFEYILMFFLALAPPLYRMMMDPRVNSIQDAKRGIKNPDAWN